MRAAAPSALSENEAENKDRERSEHSHWKNKRHFSVCHITPQASAIVRKAIYFLCLVPEVNYEYLNKGRK